MEKNFTLEYWIDDEWYVGKLKEIPGIFSQGETLDELEENIKDAYNLMMSNGTQQQAHPGSQTKEIILEVA